LQDTTTRFVLIMQLKKHLLLLFCLLSLSVYSTAAKLSEPENSSNTDSIKSHYFAPNHIMLNDSVVNFGKIFLNTPYHFGSPGISSFDCSGFTSHVYRNFGYNLGHSSVDQAKQFDSIDRTQLKAGDLVFFSGRRKSKKVGHVGIVVSAKDNGEFNFIHAAVHSGVTISNSNEEYYTKRFVKASRVIGSDQMLAMTKFVPKSDNTNVDLHIYTPVSTPAKTIKKVIPAEYHHVKSGETLSSISKKYGMTVAELKQRNNIKGNKLSLKESLKIKDEETFTVVQAVQPSIKNQALAVENSSGNNELKDDNQSNAASQTSNSHSVKKGETLFSISKIYNISVDELKKINNIIKGKIHTGQELKINQPTLQPKNETLAKVEEVKKTATHKVISGESLYSISKTYNISVDDLKRINNITNGKIHPGEELKLDQENEALAQNVVAEKQDKKQADQNKNAVKEITHKIKKGENLGSIAKENNTTVEELEKINHLTDSKIHQGQELIVAKDDDFKNRSVVAVKAEKKQEQKAENKEKAIAHKVVKGENLGSIAKENNTTVDELKRINHLADSRIHLGQELKITLDNNSTTRNVIAEKSEKKHEQKIENKEKTIAHKVVRGENLGSIANENNTTVEELERINHLADSKIHQGQELKITQDNTSKNRNALAEKEEKRQEQKIDNKDKTTTHTVKKGENLISIAKNNNMSVEELKKINHMTDSKIKFGQELKLDQSVEKTNSKKLKAEIETKSIQYKVKSGESYYTIAKKYGCTVEELEDWNGKSGSKIKAGDKITINQKART